MNVTIINQENYLSFTNELNVIMALEQDFFPFPWSKQSWDDFVRNSKFLISLGTVRDDVIGFSLFSVNELEGLGHLLKIVVEKEYRGNNYGQLLHSVIEEKLRSLNLEKLYLEVAVANLSAINLYKKLGYEQLVVKKSFYSNGNDAFAMQKELK